MYGIGESLLHGRPPIVAAIHYGQILKKQSKFVKYFVCLFVCLFDLGFMALMKMQVIW
jgi:hypothetical protein